MLKILNRDIAKDVQFFMDTIGDGILIVDNKGIITRLNTAACDMLGFRDKKDVKGQAVLALLGPIDEKGVPINKKNAALFKSIKQGKKINNVLRQFIKHDGNRIWVSITTTPTIGKKDTTKGAIIVIRDITEEKQQHDYHIDFTHIASHDLRTPIGNLLWATEYLISGKPGKLNKKQTDYINDIYKILKDMNRIINDLLSVSRLQNKKIKPQIKKVIIENTLKNIINDVAYYARAQNVKIVLKNTKKQKHSIKADPDHTRTIIQNVIENAIRYSYPNTNINIDIKIEKDNIVFSCGNTGIGIPKDKQKFIFAKFFRAKNAVDKHGDGTGLGLYITHEMVKLNKGEIWFESKPEKTTTFYVKFKKL